MMRWLRGTFAALGVPQYRVYWTSLVFTFVALWCSNVARGYVAYDLTRSNAALGGVFIAFGIPQLLLTLVGGVLADRLPRKYVALFGISCFSAEYGLMGLLIVAGVIQYWMLIFAAAFEGCVIAIYIPARTALVGDLVPASGLGNAVALQQVSFNAARVGAPVAAGALIAAPAVGPGGTYLLASALFASAVVVISRLPRSSSRLATMPGSRRGSAFRETIAGIAYVRRRPALLVLVLANYIVVMTAFPYIAFVPAVVSDLFERGAVALGVMTSTIAVGALTAAIGAASIVDGPRAWRAHTIACVGFAIALLAFAVAPTFELALAAGVLLGAGEIGFLALNQALAMRLSEPAYYGRVQSVLLFGFALFGISALPIGLLADAIGLRQMLFAEGLACLAGVSLILLFARATGAAVDAASNPTTGRAEAERGETEAVSAS